MEHKAREATDFTWSSPPPEGAEWCAQSQPFYMPHHTHQQAARRSWDAYGTHETQISRAAADAEGVRHDFEVTDLVAYCAHVATATFSTSHWRAGAAVVRDAIGASQVAYSPRQ
eukprot:5853431-Amphidinium_carterae.1